MARADPGVLPYISEMKVSRLTPVDSFTGYNFISKQYCIIKARSDFSLLCKLHILQPYIGVS